ncbi:MAG: hypothetical protein JWN01_372 [Patescibacteria group bacterium]|nr:hypothetical protein [Patescibacteria group bacterium]
MRKYPNRPILWMVVGAIMVGLIVAGIIVILHPRSPIPSSIKTQLTFPVFYPDPTTGYKIDPGSITYSARDKVLIFNVSSSGNRIVFSEQGTPGPFNDVAGYYDKFIEKLGGYASFDSTNGKVSLAHPQELKGGQSAIMNAKGTLLFAHPDKDLSDDNWHKLFNAMAMEK